MSTSKKVPNRASKIAWVPIVAMRVSPTTQRKLSPGKANAIAANFDPDRMGFPVVVRDGDDYWIQDGQHRIEACRILGWDDQQVECEVYTGLNERERAELFLARNDVKLVSRFEKFAVSVTAGHPVELDITRIVEDLDMSIGQGQQRISSVAALVDVYHRCSADGLRLTLQIIRDAYGLRAFDAATIRGIGLLIQRYGTHINIDRLIRALRDKFGGRNALLDEAQRIQDRRRHKRPAMPRAIAEAAHMYYNQAARSGRLGSWDTEDGLAS